MTAPAPTFSQIRAQVAAVRSKIEDARVIGISSPGRWAGQEVWLDGNETYVIAQCDSPLAMRLALRDPRRDATIILVTSLADGDLDDDIRVRLTKRRLFPLDSWQIVKALFQAQTIDPRVTRHAWLADEMLELIPPEGYAPIAGSVLDAERVWGVVLKARFGFQASRLDLAELLLWSTDAANVARWQNAAPQKRSAALEWLTQSGGPVVEQVLACVLGNPKPDAVPVGLASRVVFGKEAEGRLEKATGRMEERFLGGRSPTGTVLERWGQAATELVRDGLSDPRLKRSLLLRSDEILQEVGALDFAWVSNVSLAGFDQRFARLGERLAESLGGEKVEAVEAVTDAWNDVLAHDRSRVDVRRVERSGMAVRLVRWLQQAGDLSGPSPASLAEAAQYHLAEGGFVDWARLALRAGDPVQDVSRAYGTLFDRVTKIREQQAKRFAELLRDWTVAGATSPGVLRIENVLAEVVAPLSAEVPVLLIVIDGMSAAVWRELLADLARHGWTPLVLEGGHAIPPVIATIPSVTEISRASLFCGRLTTSNAGDERKAFEEHAALVSQCRADGPPLLFHKASVQESDEVLLDNEVRRQISSSRRRIVGVVINAVDDHLVKGEQVDIKWTRDEIRALPALLHEAKAAGRAVVLASDHGHILDHGAETRVHEDAGERWRLDDGNCGEGELAVAGSRVVSPGGTRLIAPWTESLRYGTKKNGYHGGLNPQEMVVPVTVMSAASTWPKGWCEAPVQLPAWWDGEAAAVVLEQEPAPTAQEPQADLGPLFPPKSVAPRAAEAVSPEKAPSGWVAAVLGSPVFAEQKDLGGRAMPSDEVLAALLTVLDEHGGKMTSTALARAMGRPPHRLSGLLAVAQRVLNVDGYAVLSRDDASESVELNRDLLCRQFGLE